MPTPLEHLFSSVAAELDLDAFVRDQREEDLHLEFKQKADRRHGNLDDGDRKAFSKAMSGFANADGGILVFGVETAKSQDGVDRAVSLKPITDHHRFRSRLLDSILNTTQPVVDDVRVEAIDSTSSQGSGFVKCFIPQSFKPPHRAILADHQYWRRVSTGHRRMEHYELEDVFGRRLRPVLQLLVELRPRPDDDPHEDIHFFLLNEGRGLARHVGFHCKFDQMVLQVSGHGLQNATSANAGIPTVTYYDAHSVIHANGILMSTGYAIIRREAKGAPLAVRATWYAENMNTRRASGVLTPGARTQLTTNPM